ncbi:MAG: 50S ribosomal protein L4 [Pseudomonadales bacterium]|uniref:Large ribosomal subunit protein uL4 n=1 Tax=Microvirgula aerodenitrificans TaxID=57480 RepID=A0A2S0P807_9NEIS|nr:MULTISPECIES: 50S ribosomal protein L4 [Microvirgula]AVY93471.1 50S ribosomal protein L4 [Microvirgula aerodenitrificans]RAS19994.1 large subunit ribosomal protein L4 [Microvirgula sp. AG722]
MELKVINQQGQAVEGLVASDALFGREYNEALVHQIVTAFLANARSGNRAQKDRSEVNKSTRKPWRQKGTGRARSGRAASPLWRGGGKVFPNSPDENFSHKVNRKMYRAGVAAILSELVRSERLIIIDEIKVDSPKTKEFAAKVKTLGLERALVITKELDENLYLSSRNLPNVLVIEAAQADPYSLVRFDKVVMTRDAVKQLEEQWA